MTIKNIKFFARLTGLVTAIGLISVHSIKSADAGMRDAALSYDGIGFSGDGAPDMGLSVASIEEGRTVDAELAAEYDLRSAEKRKEMREAAGKAAAELQAAAAERQAARGATAEASAVVERPLTAMERKVEEQERRVAARRAAEADALVTAMEARQLEADYADAQAAESARRAADVPRTRWERIKGALGGAYSGAKGRVGAAGSTAYGYLPDRPSWVSMPPLPSISMPPMPASVSGALAVATTALQNFGLQVKEWHGNLTPLAPGYTGPRDEVEETVDNYRFLKQLAYIEPLSAQLLILVEPNNPVVSLAPRGQNLPFYSPADNKNPLMLSSAEVEAILAAPGVSGVNVAVETRLGFFGRRHSPRLVLTPVILADRPQFTRPVISSGTGLASESTMTVTEPVIVPVATTAPAAAVSAGRGSGQRRKGSRSRSRGRSRSSKRRRVSQTSRR